MVTHAKYGKFPLWLHPTGQWAKKVRGRYFYFGKDRDVALAEYVRVKDDLEAGREPRLKTDGITVVEACNRFLTARRLDVDSSELTGRMWAEYHRGCEWVVNTFGKSRTVSDLTPDDFGKLRANRAKTGGTYAVAKLVRIVRTVFKFAYDEGLISVPIRYGSRFDAPAKRTIRLERAEKDKKLIDAATARSLIDAAPCQLKAMILLGLNCAFGQTDCSSLSRKAIRSEWIDFPRPKTGIGRRCWLWPETRKCIDAVHSIRPKPVLESDDDAVFLTRYGNRWVTFNEGKKGKPGSAKDAVLQELKKLTRELNLKLPGGFYILRHTFRTVVDDLPDRAAVDLVMGHNDPTMAGHYRERIDDTRIRKVAERMHQWLFDASTVAKE